MVPRHRAQRIIAAVRRLGWRLHLAADEAELWFIAAVTATAIFVITGLAVGFAHLYVSLSN